MSNRAKNKRIEIYFNEEELEKLDEDSKQIGLTRFEYIRGLINANVINKNNNKGMDKLERYNVEIRFMNDNKIDSKEELYCYYEINKESLNNLLESQKKAYEDKSKSNEYLKKKELSLLIDFYNESIKDL